MQVTFTKHALEKFDLLATFGFKLSQGQVVAAVTSSDKAERRGTQTISTKVLDGQHALRVVHEERKGIIVVITFYPVKRSKYDI